MQRMQHMGGMSAVTKAQGEQCVAFLWLQFTWCEVHACLQCAVHTELGVCTLQCALTGGGVQAVQCGVCGARWEV